jgi:glycosyltransferase involved in cell wall biosynthesis
MQDALQIVFQSLDIVICAGWLVLLAVNLREVGSYKKYTLFPAKATSGTHVSVIIPARNEEKRITSTLESVMGQSMRSLEVIVVDDRSTDKTREIVEEMQAKDTRIKLLRGEELPSEWAGKNWACHQGFTQSHHDWVLFIDSDTRIESSALTSALEYVNKEGLDALSLIPRTEYSGFLARTVGPVLMWLIRLAYPLRKVNNPSEKIGVAIGGFLMMKRTAYLEIGGHEAVKGELVEDKEIGTNLKAHRIPYRLIIGRAFAVTALFTGEQGVWNSLRRVITNPLKTGRWSKLASAVVGILLLLFPAVFLLAKLILGEASATDFLIAGVSLTAPIALVSYDASGTTPPRYRYAFLATLGGVIVMLAIARQVLGGDEVGWRGRSYVPP